MTNRVFRCGSHETLLLGQWKIEWAERVLVATTKRDKWDRYLSDVFLIRGGGAETYLNNLLLEKGRARIKSRWSLADWET